MRTCGACAGTGDVASDDGFAACVACDGTGTRMDDGWNDDLDARRPTTSAVKTRAYEAAMAVLGLPMTREDGSTTRVRGGGVVLMYFGSNRCGACRVFAPTLAAFVKTRGGGATVVAISCDDEVMDVPSGSGFARLAMAEGEAGAERRRRVNAALRALDVNLLPTLAVVHRGRGEVLTTWGRTALSLNPNGAMAQWSAGASGLDPFATETFARARRALFACAYGDR